jgi:excisionase family DNA binding protein
MPKLLAGDVPNVRMVGTDVAAQMLGVTPQTVRNLVRSGELPGRKLGGSFRIPLEALRAIAKGAQ